MTRTTIFRLAMGGGALIIALLAYGFWYENVTAASTQAAALENEITLNSARASRVAAAKEALTTLATDEDTIGQYFISSGTLVPFLEALQTTGTTLGATVTISSVSADTNNNRSELSVTGTAVGPFDSVMRFIGAAEYSPYYLTVQTLTLSDGSAPGATAASGGNWTATFLLTVGSETPITTSATDTPTVEPAAPPKTAPPSTTVPTPES